MHTFADERIRRPKDFIEIFDVLCSSDYVFFSSYAQLMIFAASLGFYHKKRTSFTKTCEKIRFYIFEKQKYFFSIFNTIAYLESNKDTNIFSDKNFSIRVNIFEEYAYGGLEIIKNRVIAPPGGKYLENMIALILEVNNSLAEFNNILPEEFELEL